MTRKQDEVGNVYNGDFEELYSAFEGITSIQINKKALRIYGENSNRYAFSKCSRTIKNVTFPKGSKLQTIQAYAFLECRLIPSIDLSECTKLESIERQAFCYCYALSSIAFPSSLKKLGSYSFRCNSFTLIKIPKSVNTIESGCFASCSKLKSVVFEDDINLSKINEYTFEHSGLETFSIPKSVTYFDSRSIWGSTSLHEIKADDNSVYKVDKGVLLTNDGTNLVFCPPALTTEVLTLPEGITTITHYAFYKCKAKEVILPNSLKIIRENAFYLANIHKIAIPNNVTSISNNIFQECKSLTEVILPNSLQTLPTKMFIDSAVTNITIPESIKTIGSSCFEGCSNLTDVILPSNITTIGGGAFSRCPNINLTFAEGSSFSIDKQFLIKSKDGKDVIQYIDNAENATIRIDSGVINIKESAFKSKTNIVGVIFESDDLQAIGDYAFYECTKLRTIEFPSNLRSIGSYAFRNCYALTSIHLKGSLQSIKIYAFTQCTGITEATFDDTGSIQQSFSSYVFYKCDSLTSITLGNNVTTIGTSFITGTKIKEIILPSSLSQTSESAFDSSALVRVSFRNSKTSLKKIETKLFFNANKLEYFEFADGIKEIGTSSFYGTKLQTISLPQSVKKLGLSCFKGCTLLKDFSISTNSFLSDIEDGVFEDCSKLETVSCNNIFFKTNNGILFNYNLTNLIIFPPASKIRVICLPNEVTMIGPSAFYSCVNLLTITITESSSLESIGANSFAKCKNLRNINIPKSVKTIGYNAFNGCRSLSCGAVVENTSISYREHLIKVSKMPKQCFVSCNELHTNSSQSTFKPKIAATSVILLVMHK